MKEIEKDKYFYYIKDSYVVNYKGADEKIRPYFCFAHNKNFCLVFPITSRKGKSSSRYKRIPIPKELWKGSKNSYLQIDSVHAIPKNTPYDNKYKVERNFGDFVKQCLIQNPRAVEKIQLLKKKILVMEQKFEQTFEKEI